MPARVICHPDDYRAAGLRRNGPVTYLAILKPLPPLSVLMEMPIGPLDVGGWKVPLEPDDSCPRGELRAIWPA